MRLPNDWTAASIYKSLYLLWEAAEQYIAVSSEQSWLDTDVIVRSECVYFWNDLLDQLDATIMIYW